MTSRANNVRFGQPRLQPGCRWSGAVGLASHVFGLEHALIGRRSFLQRLPSETMGGWKTSASVSRMR